MLSIIIVNHRALHFIEACLTSLYKYSTLSHEIIIVDNSNDDKDIILRKFPGVKWISMGYNSGFARANNEGIRQAGGDTVLLLNPDILAEDDCIDECYRQFSSSQFVACGVQLLNPDKTPQISGNYFITGGINNFLPLPVLGRIFKWLGTKTGVKKTNVPKATGVVEVDWVNGAFLMVKKPVIERSGLLDEDFFLFAEEIEWCSRIRKHGKLCIYGDLHIIHLQGEVANEAFQSSGKGYFDLSDKKGRQILVSNFVRIRKQFGAGWFLFHLLTYLLEIPLFLLLVIFQKIGRVKNRYHMDIFSGFCRNMAHLLKKSPVILRNKPHFYKEL